MTSSITLSPGKFGNDYAVNVSFSNVSGKGILHSTREYSLAYIPKRDKWVGDVIAHGGWFDLDDEELHDLCKRYNLDQLVKEFSQSNKGIHSS